MARKDALLRLTSRLIARRDALRKALNGDLDSFRRFSELNAVGDNVDAAVDSANDEICSQLVEIERLGTLSAAHLPARARIVPWFGHADSSYDPTDPFPVYSLYDSSGNTTLRLQVVFLKSRSDCGKESASRLRICFARTKRTPFLTDRRNCFHSQIRRIRYNRLSRVLHRD